MKIKNFRKLKEVNRLSRFPTFRPYNVLEHTFMVVVLFRYFAKLEDIAYDMQVLDRVIGHDVIESVTGDLPYDVKNFSSRTKLLWNEIELSVCSEPENSWMLRYSDEATQQDMSEMQYKLFKACDLLELWIFLREEQVLGNTHSELGRIVLKCEELVKGKFPHIDDYMNDEFIKGF